MPDWMTTDEYREAYQSEHAMQAAFFRWADLHANRYPALGLLFAIPNGGHRHKAVAGRLRAEGVKAGVPDVLLPSPRGGHAALFLEMKTPRGRVSKAQAAWITRLRGEGNRVEVCRSLDEAIRVTMDYLGSEEEA